ncbi:hypothetical protein A3761_20670 [Oleiphilus sp. HI0123]|nr:hypothetical protein A3761_20670 [Oleiphilus sp. HI0123]
MSAPTPSETIAMKAVLAMLVTWVASQTNGPAASNANVEKMRRRSEDIIARMTHSGFGDFETQRDEAQQIAAQLFQGIYFT